jgi:hypothetical protein
MMKQLLVTKNWGTSTATPLNTARLSTVIKVYGTDSAARDDMIADNDADDIIEGLNGAVFIYGVAGFDSLKENEGNDRINHNSLRDSTLPDGGSDEIICGPGEDEHQLVTKKMPLPLTTRLFTLCNVSHSRIAGPSFCQYLE